MRLRIISGIDNIQFCDSNIFGWFFQNFKIEAITINVQNTSVETFETAYYINIKSIKDFSKLINKASIEIIDTEYVIDEDESYMEKTLIITGLGMDDEINNFFSDDFIMNIEGYWYGKFKKRN